MKKIFEKYFLNKSGVVRRVGFPHPMKTYLNEHGYVMVQLRVGSGKKNCRIHRLVAMAYIPNPKKLPYVNHINGNKEDNRYKNLEWCTAKGNVDNALERGTHSSIKLRLLTGENRKMIRGLRTEGFGATKIARALQLPYYPVLNYLQGKNYLFDPIPKTQQIR